MKRFILIIASLFTLSFLTIPIYASITNTTGAITQTSEPSNLSLGSYENSEHIFIFKEKQGYTLSDELQVDHLVTSDTNGWLSSSGDLTSGTIHSGKKINVFLIHFDPEGDASSNPITLSGSVTFSNNIIGLEVTQSGLDNSDNFLGFSNHTYPTKQSLRGLELSGQDYFKISDNLRTLDVNLTATNSLDEIRIITATPIPSSILILSTGIIILLGVILLHRRKDTKGVNF